MSQVTAVVRRAETAQYPLHPVRHDRTATTPNPAERVLPSRRHWDGPQGMAYAYLSRDRCLVCIYRPAHRASESPAAVL